MVKKVSGSSMTWIYLFLFIGGELLKMREGERKVDEEEEDGEGERKEDEEEDGETEEEVPAI